MLCPKCKTNLEPGAAFCPVCGERMEKMILPKGSKIRKEYNTAVYILLDLFGGGLFLGINDFYAGYINVAVIRCLFTIIGFILSMSTSTLAFLFFPGVSLLVGFIELFAVTDKAYAYDNNSRVMFIRPLDLIYDRKGTENLVKLKYGCDLPFKKRKEFSTGVYIALYLFLGGWVLCTNDFYAGYIKTAVIRIGVFFIGGMLGSLIHIVIGYLFLFISILIGFIELLLVGEKKYTLEDGNLAMVRPLDLIYDRKATEAVLIEKYGCGLADKKK